MTRRRRPVPRDRGSRYRAQRPADGRLQARLGELEVAHNALRNRLDSTDGALAAEQRVSQILGAQVDEGAEQLRRLTAELTLAEEREREAIARDLHDNLAQLLHVVRLKLAGALRDPVGERTAQRLRELDELARRAEAGARSLVFKLVPPVLAELGLVPALQWLAEDLERTHGLKVEVRDDGAAERLPHDTRTVVYRAVRELLINVAKHAQADRASVEVSTRDAQLRVAVRDDGHGFDAAQVLSRPPKGLGLVSLRERIRFIGGNAEIRSVPGDGTKAQLTVPLAGEGRR